MSRAWGFLPDRPPEEDSRQDPARERKEVLAIIAALTAAIAPHVPGLPLWINLWCLSMWGYMLIRLKTGWPLPSSPVRYLLTFTGMRWLGMITPIGGTAFIIAWILLAVAAWKRD